MSSPKSKKSGENEQIFTWILVAAVIFLVGYLVINMFCKQKKEGLDISTQYLIDTVGGNYNAQQLAMTAASMPKNLAQIHRNDLADDDALNYFNSFHNDAMRVGKSLAYQDAMVNRYTKVKEMAGL